MPSLRTLAKLAVLAIALPFGGLAMIETATAEGVLPVTLPAPALDETAKTELETAVFASGASKGSSST